MEKILDGHSENFEDGAEELDYEGKNINSTLSH